MSKPTEGNVAAIDQLRETARTLDAEVGEYDKQIREISSKRAAVAKQLRAVMGKIVTHELKTKK